MAVVLVFACSDVTSDDDDAPKDEHLSEKFRFFKFVVSLVLSPPVGVELGHELELGLPPASALEPSRLCSLLVTSVVVVSLLAVIGSADDGSDGSEGHGSSSSMEASELGGGGGGGDTVCFGWPSQTVASPCSSSSERCFFSV